MGEDHPYAPVTEVVGRVNIVRARERYAFAEEVNRLIEEGRTHFLFDLREVHGWSATAGFLMMWPRRLAPAGGRCAMIGGALLRGVLKWAEDDESIPRNFEREEDALAWLHDLA